MNARTLDRYPRWHGGNSAFAIVFACAAAIVGAIPAIGSAEDRVDKRGEVPAAEIDKICARWNKDNSPGVVVAVIRDGRIEYQRGYGMANLEQDVPLTTDSVFYIASTSKQFTAASMALLARQGKVSLDDDVRKYIGELPDYGKTITIRHLIHHTSGLRDYLMLGSLAGRTAHGLTTADAVRLIARQKRLNAPPGEEFSYTNSGYVLLSAIIERTSGQSLREFADSFIFRPLGMTHSVFRDDISMILKRRAVGYAAGPSGFRTADADIEATGDGNLWTTVGDLALWDHNFYENRLGDGLIDQLLTPGQLADGQGLKYAYGLFVDQYKGLRRVQHGGAFAGFRAELVRFPDQRVSVVCLANLANVDPGEVALQVADLYLKDHFLAQTATPEPPPVKLTADALAALAGAYRNPRDGGLWKFVVQDSTLALDRLGPLPLRLQPTGQTTFRDQGGRRNLTCEFLTPQDGKPRQVRVRAGENPPRILETIAIESPTPEALQECIGSYYSTEIEATFTLSVNNGRLQIDSPRRSRQSLRPTIRDEFTGNEGTLQFERDAAGRVAAFRYNVSQAQGLVFDRQPNRQ